MWLRYFNFCFVFSVVFSLKYLQIRVLLGERESAVGERAFFSCVFPEVMEWSRGNVSLEKRLCEHREKCSLIIFIFLFCFLVLCFR